MEIRIVGMLIKLVASRVFCPYVRIFGTINKSNFNQQRTSNKMQFIQFASNLYRIKGIVENVLSLFLGKMFSQCDFYNV